MAGSGGSGAKGESPTTAVVGLSPWVYTGQVLRYSSIDRPRRAGADELRVAGVLVDEALQPGHELLGEGGVGGLREEVAGVVQLQVGLLRLGDAVVERAGVRGRGGDAVALARHDQGRDADRAPGLVGVPRRDRHGGLERGPVLGGVEGAAAAHRVAGDREAVAVDAVAYRGRAAVDQVVEGGQELVAAAGGLVEGRVGLDADDDEAVRGEARA